MGKRRLGWNFEVTNSGLPGPEWVMDSSGYRSSGYGEGFSSGLELGIVQERERWLYFFKRIPEDLLNKIYTIVAVEEVLKLIEEKVDERNREGKF
jgi:hypothetical protein